MRWLIAAAVSSLTTAFVGLSAVGGWFYWERVQTHGEESARATLPPQATKDVPRVLGYDYQTVERSMDDVYPLLTPAYRQVFKKQVNQDIIPEARKRQVVRQVDISGAGVMSAKGRSARVLVYMPWIWAYTSKEPVYKGSRVR